MKRLRKLHSNKGATMALSLVIAIVISTVSLAISALVAQVAINQVNSSKASFKNMDLKNTMYTLLNDYYQQTNFDEMIGYTSETSVAPTKGTYSWKDPGYYCGTKHKYDGTTVSCPSEATQLEFAYNAKTLKRGSDTQTQGTVYFSYPTVTYEKVGSFLTAKTKWYIASSQKDGDDYQICLSEYEDFKYGQTGEEQIRCKVEFGKRSYSVLEMETTTWNGNFYFKA